MQFAGSLIAITLLLAQISSALDLRRASSEPYLEQRQAENDRYANWPSINDLPLDPSYPFRAAWGVWGDNDTIGALNHITPDVVQSAASLIQLGQVYPLNPELDLFPTSIVTDRGPLIHTFRAQDGFTDDVITLNTQINAQYDGLRHFSYSDGTGNSSTYRYYNDLIPNYEDVIGSQPTRQLGIHEAAQRGIVGRGVLLDFARWAEANGIEFDPLESFLITADHLDSVASWQGLPSNWSQPGDILVLRTGWIRAFQALSLLDRATSPWIWNTSQGIGVQQDEQMVQWLWDKKFAIVAGDQPAFEALPPMWRGQDPAGVPFHEILISGWGTSIVELLDLERLAEALRQNGRSTFFLTMQPLNIVSGIASPPNAVAVI